MVGAMRLAVVVLALGLLVGCGDDGDDATPAGSPECREAEDGRVTIVADKVQWDTDCLRGPAGEPLTIVIDNQDKAVPHNLHITDAPANPKTELETGPVTQELEVTLDAGDYEFVCDIHPNMVGTLMMVEASSADT